MMFHKNINPPLPSYIQIDTDISTVQRSMEWGKSDELNGLIRESIKER